MIKQGRSRKERGLSKYDAPLIIQYTKGVNAFRRNDRCPYSANSMQYREWLRGWNSSYSLNLKKVKSNEARRRGKEVYG
tara:strand:+ start:285 stop:521 length:237 start_codon:yes stop_codon:yes gene_type:complete